MSRLKLALVRTLARTADAGLTTYARKQRAAQSAEEGRKASGSAESSAAAEEADEDCLPCQAIERRKRAEDLVKGVLG